MMFFSLNSINSIIFIQMYLSSWFTFFVITDEIKRKKSNKHFCSNSVDRINIARVLSNSLWILILHYGLPKLFSDGQMRALESSSRIFIKH